MSNKDSEKSAESHGSVRSGRHRRLRPSGGYRDLRSFQVATVIYDATVSFCDRFVDKRSRTHDQMVQAARSGRQNIAEGSRAAATSSQTELRLVNVARASLDELLLDYEDFLRQHDSMASASGKRTTRKRVKCERWGREEIGLIRPIRRIRRISGKPTRAGWSMPIRQWSQTRCCA